MNRRSIVFASVFAALSLSAVACAPLDTEDEASATRNEESAANDTLANPPPRPVVLTCVTKLGSYDVGSQAQCEKLLAAAGCTKPGAVVGDKQKCSTASTEEEPAPRPQFEGPTNFAAPAPEPVVLKCILPTGTHEGLTQPQCEALLRLSGCKPGAVVNDTQKCSTTSEGGAAGIPGGPGDLTTPPPRPIPITCKLPSGTHGGLTQDQCETLLKLSGCKPGAVVNDTQKCSTSS